MAGMIKTRIWAAILKIKSDNDESRFKPHARNTGSQK